MQDEVPHVALDAVETSASGRSVGWTGWIGTAIGVAALITSVVSIWLALKNAGSMNQLVQANSWPHLQILTSNSADDSEREIRFTIENTGAGPAKLHSVVAYLDDQPMPNASVFVKQACDCDPSATLRQNIGSFTPSNKVLDSGYSIIFLRIPYHPDTEEAWERIDRSRFTRLRFRGCYCSVFDECWETDFESLSKTSVDLCEPDGDNWRG